MVHPVDDDKEIFFFKFIGCTFVVSFATLLYFLFGYIGVEMVKEQHVSRKVGGER